MLVKAKWNIKDDSGWHMTGEVFQTKEDLGDAVEILDGAPKRKMPEVTEDAKAAPETEENEAPRAGRKKAKAAE